MWEETQNTQKKKGPSHAPFHRHKTSDYHYFSSFIYYLPIHAYDNMTIINMTII